MEALARGVKKITSKNSAYLEPFFLVEAEILPGKEINHLTKVQPVNSFKNIRVDLRKILMAGYAADLADKFLQNGEKDARIFHLMNDWLVFLNDAKAADDALLHSFILKFLALAGFKPELRQCVSCGKKQIAGFYFAGGGVVCAPCQQAKKSVGEAVVDFTDADAAGAEDFLAGAWEDIRHPEEDKLFDVILSFAQYHCEKSVKKFWAKPCLF